MNTMNGTYSCQQQYDVATKDNVIVANKNEVQLVVSVDTALLPGLLALLQSIKVNNKKGTNIAIHVLVSVVDRQHVEDEVLCTVKMPPNIKVCVYTDIMCSVQLITLNVFRFPIKHLTYQKVLNS